MTSAILTAVLFAKSAAATWPRPLPARPEKSGVERQRGSAMRQAATDKVPAAVGGTNGGFFQWPLPSSGAAAPAEQPAANADAPAATTTPPPAAATEQPAAPKQQ